MSKSKNKVIETPMPTAEMITDKATEKIANIAEVAKQAIEATLPNADVKVIPMVKPGRPVDPNSTRQIELALKAQLRAEGKLNRGRPSVPGSARQLREAEKAIKRAKGELTGERGRPVVPGSARQEKVAKLKEKENAGLPILPGRPPYTAEQKAASDAKKAEKKVAEKAANVVRIAEQKALKAIIDASKTV